MAAAALSRREVNRIILTRPAVEAGERLGFLPGDLMAKIDPYLRPLFDALHDMLDPEKVSAHLEKGVIEVAPLAFMRGRTLNDSFVILDEAQNTSPEQMKMFLTRLGFDSKMVITGDITQIDLPREQQSGLVVVGDILDDIDGVDFVRFGGADVVRHRLVQRIVEAYGEHAEQPAPELRPADRARRARSAPCSRSRSSGASGRPRSPGARGRAPRRASRSRRRASTRATWRSSSSTPERIAELNGEHRGKDGPTDVLSFPVDERRAPGPARARRRRDLPGAHRRPARGHRPRRAAPRGHGPRDRRGRDARAPGASCWAGEPRAGSSRSPGGRTSASRRSSTRSSARRSRSSPTSRRRRAGPSAAWRRAPTRSSCSSTCPACSARATRSPSACSAASSASWSDSDAALIVLNGEEGVGPGDRFIADALREAGLPVVVAVNKVDRLDRPRTVLALSRRRRSRSATRSSPSPRGPGRAWRRCSSTSCALVPEGPFLFGAEDHSDQPPTCCSPS